MAHRTQLDLRRLARDADTASSKPLRTPGGQPLTGLMQAVRENLDALLTLKAEGRSWEAIAIGLTAQGFTTADGRPIDQRNLTGIISTLQRRARHKADRQTARTARSDIIGDGAASPAAKSLNSPPPTLSPDLVAVSKAVERPRPAEDERRRAALARAKSLLKKD